MSVSSPLGIMSCVALVAPFMSPEGQEEVHKAWEHQMVSRDYRGVPDTPDFIRWMRDQADHLNYSLGAESGMGGAVDLFSRGEDIDGAVSLPMRPKDAQDYLDEWTNKNTLGLITESPIEVNSMTRLVASSALAVNSKWRSPAYKHGHDSFLLDITPKGVFSSDDGSSVLVTTKLANSLTVKFCATDDPSKKPSDLILSKKHWRPIQPSDGWMTTMRLGDHYDGLAVRLPAFGVEHKTDMALDPERWGLVHGMEEGLPVIGPDIAIDQAVSNSKFWATHEGIKAASVTATSAVVRSMPRLGPVDGVDLMGTPLAFAVWHRHFRLPLFMGEIG